MRYKNIAGSFFGLVTKHACDRRTNYDSQDRTRPRCAVKLLHGRFVHVGKTLTDLQILGSELQQNAFGGRAPPGPAGGAIALPQTPSRY